MSTNMFSFWVTPSPWYGRSSSAATGLWWVVWGWTERTDFLGIPVSGCNRKNHLAETFPGLLASLCEESGSSVPLNSNRSVHETIALHPVVGWMHFCANYSGVFTNLAAHIPHGNRIVVGGICPWTCRVDSAEFVHVVMNKGVGCRSTINTSCLLYNSYFAQGNQMKGLPEVSAKLNALLSLKDDIS